MAVYEAPGVYIKEVDLAQRVERNATTVAALVGFSKKGSTSVRLITNVQEFIQEYGKPELGNYFYYSALGYLRHGINLYCRRIINGALLAGIQVVTADSSSDSAALSVGRAVTTFVEDSLVPDEIFTILAKDPGAWGNRIKIKIQNVKNAYKVVQGGVAYKCLKSHISSAGTEPGTLDGTPYWEATSDGIADLPAWSSSSVPYVEEDTEAFTFDIIVQYTDTEGNVSTVETWTVSRKRKVGGSGKQLYLEDAINDFSDYIVVADNVSVSNNTLPKEIASFLAMGAGSDGSEPTASQLIGVEADKTGWYSFINSNEYPVRMLIGGCYTANFSNADIVLIQQALKSIAESRSDCIAIIEVPLSETTDDDDAIAYRNDTLTINSNRVAGPYSPWVKDNDPYNDVVVEVPPSGYVAGQFCYNDQVGDVWDAPAGQNRGVLDVLGVTTKYSDTQIAALYRNGINTIILENGAVIINGQKTMQKKASPLNRLNVRRLFISLAIDIKQALTYFKFEANDDITRFSVTTLIEKYMRDLSSRGAFEREDNDSGYKILCDDKNNGPEVRSRNELHVDIFVKPVQTAEFIPVQLILTPSGVSFNELISKGVMF